MCTQGNNTNQHLTIKTRYNTKTCTYENCGISNGNMKNRKWKRGLMGLQNLHFENLKL